MKSGQPDPGMEWIERTRLVDDFIRFRIHIPKLCRIYDMAIMSSAVAARSLKIGV